MRNITFRGYSSEHDRWVYGSLLQRGCEAYIETKLPDSDDPEQYVLISVVAESVGQCTEFVDIKENYIFEGDVVCFVCDFEPHPTFRLIKQSKGCWVASNPNSCDWEEFCDCFSQNELADALYLCLGEVFVLGNIYEHTELMKVVEVSRA